MALLNRSVAGQIELGFRTTLEGRRARKWPKDSIFCKKTNASDSLPKAIRMEFELQTPRETAEIPKCRGNSDVHLERRRLLKMRCELGNALIRKRKFHFRDVRSTEFMRLPPNFALKTRIGSHRLR